MLLIKEELDNKKEIKVDIFNDESKKIITLKDKVIYYNKEYDVMMMENMNI